MSTAYPNPSFMDTPFDFGSLRKKWLWFVLLGVLLIVVAMFALGSLWAASLATAVVIGAVMITSGIFEIVGAFWSRGWSGFFLHLLSGVLSLVVGVLFLMAPVDALLVLTMLLACFLIVNGVFKIIAALTYRMEIRGWVLFSGVLDGILGALILFQWPEAAHWVLGLFVGISLLVRGLNWIIIGLALKSLPPSRSETM